MTVVGTAAQTADIDNPNAFDEFTEDDDVTWSSMTATFGSTCKDVHLWNEVKTTSDGVGQVAGAGQARAYHWAEAPPPPPRPRVREPGRRGVPHHQPAQRQRRRRIRLADAPGRSVVLLDRGQIQEANYVGNPTLGEEWPGFTAPDVMSMIMFGTETDSKSDFWYTAHSGNANMVQPWFYYRNGARQQVAYSLANNEEPRYSAATGYCQYLVSWDPTVTPKSMKYYNRYSTTPTFSGDWYQRPNQEGITDNTNTDLSGFAFADSLVVHSGPMPAGSYVTNIRLWDTVIDPATAPDAYFKPAPTAPVMGWQPLGDALAGAAPGDALAPPSR